MSAGAASPRGSAARIVPRVFVSAEGAIRIEVAVGEAVSAGAMIIEVVGQPGAGKTTALKYLEEQLCDLGLVYLDSEVPLEIVHDTVERGQPVVVASDQQRFGDRGVVLHLAPWGPDEVIEWAIGEPRETRGSFVQRAMEMLEVADESRPEVLTAIWQAMPFSPARCGFGETIELALRERLGTESAEFEVATEFAWNVVRSQTLPSSPCLEDRPSAMRLLRHRSVLLETAAIFASSALASGKTELLRDVIASPVLERIARRVRESGAALEALHTSLAGPANGFSEAMAISLLHAAGAEWKPVQANDPRIRNFQGATLAGVRWADAWLESANLSHANLAEADLEGANLSRIRVRGTRLAGANLRGANLHQARGHGAEFGGACVEGAELKESVFSRSSFMTADLSGVAAAGAMFVLCNMQEARLRGADVGGGLLARSELGEADLTGASFRLAMLRDLDLRLAHMDDVVLAEARLLRCDLSGMLATGMNCRDAIFSTCEMTGSVLRCACFAGAKLCGCGLAEIWWQGADLRGADFTGSTFHMGSSRSGLVGSTIAGEGSRTGFYADDYAAQDYKPPEEISKADLRGADLRDAIVEGVDFYLVDLRGAVYDRVQAEWFRKCGAIMHSRV